jgi:ABC-type multidrug transport system fused ATPase/permease subunit
MCNGLSTIVNELQSITDPLLAVQKLYNLEKAPQELPVSPAGSTEITPPSDWPTKGAVEFKDVDLRYRPELDKTLIGLSFKAEAGHKIGVVGRSGCGKSTMCLALTRIVEICGGTVLVDGVEVSKVNLDKVR